MITVGIKWLLLLAVSEIYLTILLVSKMNLSDPSHWVMIMRISLEEALALCFGFMRGHILVEDLGGPTSPLTYHGSLLLNNSA